MKPDKNGLQHNFSHILDVCDQIFLGKIKIIKLALACLIGKGHLLIEDIPGVGKTTLVKLLAKVFNLKVGHIQLTSDLLPADILGNSVFDPQKNEFKVIKGPIFNQLILADELNRATPKTQSAFLGPMEERKVHIDTSSYILENPFLIMATQNPKELLGTFPLPESQLDRFMMRIHIGHPTPEIEKKLINGIKRSTLINELQPLGEAKDIINAQETCSKIKISETILDYTLKIMTKCREIDQLERFNSYQSYPLSTRAGIALIDAAKAWAYLNERSYVVPEDISEIFTEVLFHRVFPFESNLNQSLKNDFTDYLLSISST